MSKHLTRRSINSAMSQTLLESYFNRLAQKKINKKETVMKTISIPLTEYIDLLENKILFLSEQETDSTPEITKEIKELEKKLNTIK